MAQGLIPLACDSVLHCGPLLQQTDQRKPPQMTVSLFSLATSYRQLAALDRAEVFPFHWNSLNITGIFYGKCCFLIPRIRTTVLIWFKTCKLHQLTPKYAQFDTINVFLFFYILYISTFWQHFVRHVFSLLS